MAITQRPFKVEIGIEDDLIYRLSGTGVPGISTITNDAPRGSEYIDESTGNQYLKVTPGTGTDKWEIQATQAFVADEFDEFTDIISEPTGFPISQREGTDISFVSGTATVTISAESPLTEFHYYIKGTKYTVTGSDSVTLPGGTGAAEGLYFIYYKSTAPTTLIATKTVWDTKEDGLVAAAYWDGTRFLVCADERHGVIMDGQTHEYLHLTVFTRYQSGLGAGDFVVSDPNDSNIGDSNSHATLSIGDGTIFDEDLRFDIADDVIQDLAPIAEIPVFYRLGAIADNWKKKDENDYPVFENIGNQISWNFNDAGDWKIPAAAYGEYVAVFLFATTCFVQHPIIAIMGQRVDGTLLDARNNNTVDALELGTLPFSEWKVIYRLIFKTDSLTMQNDVRAALVDIQDLRVTVAAPGAQFVSTDHGSLTGLNDFGDHHASAIEVTPTGNIASDNVQAALAEVDSENLARDGSQDMTGDLDFGGNYGIDLLDPVNPQDAATKAYVDAQVGTQISWREPVQVHDNTSFELSAIVADLNDAGNTIQGVTIFAGMRILASQVSTSPTIEADNIYIVSGSVGSWILTEDTNSETPGDVVYVEDGTHAGTRWVYNKNNQWVKIDQANLDELGFIRTFIGKGAAGLETPLYTEENHITDGDSLELAIDKLDIYLGPFPTAEIRTNNPIIPANDVNENIEALDDAIGDDADLVSTTYISTGQNIYQNLSDLDAAITAGITQFSVAVAAAPTWTTVDSVDVHQSTSPVESIKWILDTIVPATGRKRGVEIHAIHDGYSGSDAANADFTVYARLRVGTPITGLKIRLIFTGSTTTRKLELQVQASIATNARGLRLKVDA